MTEYPPIRLIDAFSGCGGMTYGFVNSSKGVFRTVWANDINRHAAESYNANFGNHCVIGDITELLKEPNLQLPKADLVIGGPPCQGFSLLNRDRADDPRKGLWEPFLQIVNRSGAECFVMENMAQLLGSPEHEEIVKKAENMGFKVTSAKLCAADYGVPQRRTRAFIVGCKFVDPARYFPPPKTHFNPNNGFSSDSPSFEYVEGAQPWVTVRDAISDLPTPAGTDMGLQPSPLDLHFGRTPTALSLARYKSIPEEGMNRFDLQRIAPELTPKCWIRKTKGGTDLFGRLWWDRPAFTIRTEFFKPEKGRYLHPEQHRPITHREAARLQSFPDDFIFQGNKIEIAKQIGNAVPPLMAARIADAVYEMFLHRI
jgi:DNA (cytosine-5)-methyltransferase 1